MLAIDIAALVLLTCAACFSVVELGQAAYIIKTGATREYAVYRENLHDTGYGGWEIGYIHGDAPAQIKFLLFCSCWTIFFAGLLFLAPFVVGPFLKKPKKMGKSQVSYEQYYGFVSLCIDAVTMVLWIAGFGSLAHFYNGVYATGLSASLLSFGILIWVTYLLLLIIDFGTTVGTLKSNRLGRNHIQVRRRRDSWKGKSISTSTSERTTPMASFDAGRPYEQQQPV